MSALHLNIDSYTLFWYYILGLVLLIGLAHIATYFFNVRATRLNLKTQRAFLLRTQRHLSTFWWVLIAAILVMVFGVTGALVVCAIVSFMGLREFVTLTPVKSGDYRALFFSFFVFLPLQYVLIGLQEFGFFTVLIPVYAFLLLPILTIVHADTDRFLSRSASMQWGLMIAVYCLSHTVAILQTQAVIDFSTAGKALMLLFFLILVRFSMLWQHLADYGFRSRTTRIAAKIHSRMTWQGFVVSALMNALIAAAFFKLTPFTFWQAAIAGALIASSAVFGRLVMRGITYSLGIKDWGELTGGQQGVMDRLDAFLYAAPIFFHYAQFVTEHGGF
jgi:phosphatidate cytidylyltransferase